MLSCGHSSLTLYVQLYLSGYGLSLDDLKSLRQWGSLTPGHPEHGHTTGVETTTGPLGQGVGNAVGMAMAARRERGLFDPDTEPGESVFDHNIWAIASDGDLEEGISHEASALAGHQKLGNLTLIYDDNEISIEDDTRIAKSDDVAARYEAYGWHVQTVDWRTGDADRGRVPRGRRGAVPGADGREGRDRPARRSSRCAPSSAGPPRTRRTPARSTARRSAPTRSPPTKEILGFDPEESFAVDDEVLDARPRGRRARPRRPTREWQQAYDAWAADQPRRARPCTTGWPTRTLPQGWTDALPEFPADAKGIATRAASGKVLDALAPVLPELWGGSADLAESNNTTMKGEPSFIPAEHATKAFPGDEYGRTLHFGIREHAHGRDPQRHRRCTAAPARTAARSWSSATTCARAVRLAALMKLPVTYVWTHDSIGLGEDGPTHQPIEHLTALRAIPGLDVVRPADANETAWAWRQRAGAHRPADRAGAEPAEPADLDRSDVRVGRGRRQGRLRPGRGVQRQAAGDPHRHRLRGAALPHRPGAAGGRGHPDPGRVHALPGVVRRAGRGVPASRCCRAGSRPGSASRPASRCAGAARRRHRRVGQHRALRRQRPRHGAVRAVRVHRRQRGGRGPRRPDEGRRHHRFQDRQLRSSAMTDRLAELSAAGVAVWLDDLSRVRLTSGGLDQLRREKHVVGVTTNPTIFAKALADADAYDAQLKDLASRGVQRRGDGADADGVRRALGVRRDEAGVRRVGRGRRPGVHRGGPAAGARDRRRPPPRRGRCGGSSTAPTSTSRSRRPRPGLPAITETLAAGISVNVTLIFSLERYKAVMDAFLAGLEQAKANGHDLTQIGSVASFFVSRVDTEIDKRLDKIGSDEAKALKGKAAIANAQLAYEAYAEVFSSARWQALADAGAHPQRPLWASTGTKNPEFKDTIYVEELIAPGTVNTMPENVITAYADHGETRGDTVTGSYAAAHQVMDDIAAAGCRLRRRVRGARVRGCRQVRDQLDGAARGRPEVPRRPRPRAPSNPSDAANDNADKAQAAGGNA